MAGYAIVSNLAASSITRPFYLGIYPVTQAEYRKVIGTNPSYFSPAGSARERVRGLDTSRFPVEGVSWDDAVDFCARLTRLPQEKQAKRSYRLPTEAEWEYACRAGTKTAFNCGESLSHTQANTRTPDWGGRAAWARTGPTAGACTICTATSASGAATDTMTISTR
jgi:formylglycine-generating enzyme required for sulfatase activity